MRQGLVLLDQTILKFPKTTSSPYLTLSAQHGLPLTLPTISVSRMPLAACIDLKSVASVYPVCDSLCEHVSWLRTWYLELFQAVSTEDKLQSMRHGLRWVTMVTIHFVGCLCLCQCQQ